MRKCVAGWIVTGCLVTMSSVPAGATTTISSWTPIYQGVDYATAVVSANDPSGPQSIHVMRVDVNAPGVSFYSTPHSYKYTPINVETFSQTSSQFVVSSGVQVAINANYFDQVSDSVSQAENLYGLAVSNGNLVAPAQTDSTQVGQESLLISSSNQASFASTLGGTNLSNVYTAISGSALILQNGVNIGAQHPLAYGDPTHPNPQTVVGLSQDGQYLYMMTIDGRQPGFAAGTTMVQTANWIAQFGAYNAMALDNGGSTTMVRSDGSGGAILLNSPSDGTERYLGNNFGVYALPLPEPGSLGLMALGALPLLGRRRRLN